MRKACEAFDLPVMANMASGGLTPVLPGNLRNEIGYAFAICPSLTSLVSAATVEKPLMRLCDQADGEPADIVMFDFKTFCSLIGFAEVWDFEKKWAQ
ncbi:MAG: hypothetical protein RJS97_01795 [Parvibaculaceae bacterium]